MAAATTDNNFEKDVLRASKPVLVDFWAEWCGPCRQLGPIIDQISEEKSDSLGVYKVNIDENPETPTTYGVRGIPTMVIFKDGEPIATKVGSVPKSELEAWINQTLSSAA